MPEVFFVKENIKTPAAEGERLFDVMLRCGIRTESPCGGDGRCGKCRVRVNGKEVLACRTVVTEDIRVETFVLPALSVLTTEKTAEEASGSEGNLGLALDIGTTTLAAVLFRLGSGAEIASAGMENPQRRFGADVITRIRHCRAGGFEEEKTLIQNALSELVLELCRKACCGPEQIIRICAAGNPAMQQIFLGVPVENLASPPFAAAITKAKIRPAAELLPVCEKAELLVVPNLSGFLGSDTLCGMLYTNLAQSAEPTLFMDVGTNSEMALAAGGRIATCSAAAGPALEGANIRCGMPCAIGAIDRVTVRNGQLVCGVFGGGEARGICGSGLADAVASALTLKLINHRGRIQNPEEENGERLIPLSGEIFLNQNDIRQFQLAKGAMAAGAKLLAEELDLAQTGVKKILLAGGFGSSLNPVSALKIGLLSYGTEETIKAVGNTALAGAKLLVLHPEKLRECEELLTKTEHLELGSLPNFPKTFAACSLFPEE